MAAEQGIKSKAPTVPMFYKSANRGINWFGRMWELGLMAELYTREFFAGQLDFRQLFKYDIPLAVKMLRTGKLKILPSIARRSRNGRSAGEAAGADAAPVGPDMMPAIAQTRGSGNRRDGSKTTLSPTIPAAACMLPASSSTCPPWPWPRNWA